MASPQFEQIFQTIRSWPTAVDLTLEQLRDGINLFSAGLPLPDGTHCKPDIEADGVPCEWVTPPDVDEGRVMFYLHGGGYVMGSIESHRGLAARLARAAGARTLIVDYRLAPEHPFPAAVDDATTAYRWLLAQGFDPARVVIAGDSAGGGLTAATLLALRDAGEAMPAGAACMSPWLDLACESKTMISKAKADPMLTRGLLLEWAAHYLNGTDSRAPLASPLRGDLAGLPPLLVQVGTAEVLLDDSVRLAERARAAGVDVTLEQWDEMFHVWHVTAFAVPEAQRAIERVGAWIRERTS